MIEDLIGLLIVWFLLGAAMAVVGSWIATLKGHAPFEGALLGFLLGPFGVLIEALLPTIYVHYAPSTPGLDFDDGGLDDMPPIASGLDLPADPRTDAVRLGIVDDRGLDGRARKQRTLGDEENHAVRRTLREMERSG